MEKKEKTSYFSIPETVSHVTETLKKANFKAFLVGGCVRDLILQRKPKDWDVTTNAKPEEIIALFPKTFYENNFGTVGVVDENVSDETLKVIEITPFRVEGQYSDFRRPDTVSFSDKLEDDLARRDFTINALALDVLEKQGEFYKGQIIDLYKGQEDLQAKTLKTVGKPEDRFSEDALRMLRAVRFASELDFTIDPDTERAISVNAHLLKKISKERIRDEFTKLILSPNPMKGLMLCRKLSLIRYIVPELEESYGVEQNQAHSYDVWEHLLHSVQCSADKNFPLDIRLAALFHDISKPKARRWGEEQKQWTFYGHEVVGSRETKRILTDLRFPVKLIEKVVKLVRWHMFFSDTEQISLSAVRRMVVNVGKENIWDLMNVRICDRIGTGRPKEDPYRLRKYHAMIDEAMRDPISVGMLKIDGKGIMDVTHETPGPKIGFVLHALLQLVLDDPTKNTETFLVKQAIELIKLPVEELKKLGEEGKDKREQVEDEEVKKLRSRHRVR
ncbi:MAG: HD domain-containing protein [Candidatus Paceibacterota bacterium]|jgi:poly(A) polymerase/tRNA nucleotidyltransferase (CCA-adding enzyme)